jgi:hypothetical protein
VLSEAHVSAPLHVRLEGHLTRERLASALGDLVTGGRAAPEILVDALAMDSYDLDARHAFVEWMRKSSPRKVAILTKRPMWRMVIGSMALASGIAMQAFPDAEAAAVWLRA